MLSPVPVLTPRCLSPDAPACQPCPWPARRSTPHLPTKVSFSIGDCTYAFTRCQEVAQTYPAWPRSRVRAQVARELKVATTQLRYLLRRAARPDEAPTLDADTPALAT